MFDVGVKGFHIAFSNGWTASVQWGVGNYCDNKDSGYDPGYHVPPCPNAEIAAWRDDDWYRGEDWTDDVRGWQTPEQVAQFLATIAALP